MFITLPKRLTEGNNIEPEAELTVREGAGVYVYVWRSDNGKHVEFPEEGNGEPEALPRLLKHVRRNRRGYVIDRIEQALSDNEWRADLGLLPTNGGGHW